MATSGWRILYYPLLTECHIICFNQNNQVIPFFVSYFSLKTIKETLVAGSVLPSGEEPPQFFQMPSWGPPPPALNLSLPPTTPAQAGHTLGVGHVDRCQATPVGGREDLLLCRQDGGWGRGPGWLGAAGSSASPSWSCSGAAACGQSAPPRSF